MEVGSERPPVPTRPLRVLVVHNNYQQRGGEDVAVGAETELLRSHGHEVFNLTRDNAQLAHASRLGMLADTIWSRSAHREVTDAIGKYGPDLIHVHNTFPQFSPAIYWAAEKWDVPVFQTLHNFRLLCAQAMFLRNEGICEDCLGKLPWRGVLRRCYRDSATQSAALVSMLGVHRALGSFRSKVTRYIALSQFSRQRFIEGGLPSGKIRIKPNFVDIPARAPTERRGGMFVGRLSKEKGLQVLLGALDRVPVSSLLRVIGTGPQEDLVAQSTKCQALGWQSPEQIYEWMFRSAYLVMPSIAYEQFPRVLAEAFGCGLPIIASRLGPLAELVEDGKTGLLFEPGSIDDLARKIEFAERNPEVIRSMGANARAQYESSYTAETNFQQLMTIYEEVLSPKANADNHE